MEEDAVISSDSEEMEEDASIIDRMADFNGSPVKHGKHRVARKETTRRAATTGTLARYHGVST